MAASWMTTYFEQVKNFWLFCWLWVSQKLNWRQNSHGRNWIPEHFMANTSCHQHSTLASQTCEGLHQLWALPRHKAIFFFFFIIWMLRHPVFNSHSHMTYGTPCHARGRSHPCLGKQRISLGVGIILSICLCSHT